jgi:hypothetical protein
MKTAVDKVGKGKERFVNGRFAAMCAHYLIEATFSAQSRRAGRRGAWRRTSRTADALSGKTRWPSVSLRSPNSMPGSTSVVVPHGKHPGIRTIRA